MKRKVNDMIPFGNTSNNNANYNSNDAELGSTLYLGAYIQWCDSISSSKRGFSTCGYALYKNVSIDYKTLIRSYFYFIGDVDSQCEAELKALMNALEHIPPEEPLMVRTTEANIVNGINRYLTSWYNNNWLTKQGRPIKNQNEWQALFPILINRKIKAFYIKNKIDQEIYQLRASCKRFMLPDYA